MVYTLVLEASAARIESSSLSLGTISCIVLEKVCVHQANALSMLSLSAGTQYTVVVRGLWVMPVILVMKLEQASTDAPYKLAH